MIRRLSSPRRAELRRLRPGRGPLLLALMVVVLVLSPSFSSGTLSEGNATDILANFAQIGPIALAAGLGMLLGEFDISVVASYGIGQMLVTQIHADPYLQALLAAAAGAAIGGVQGLIVARLDINAVPVTLGGYLLISGVVAVLGHGASVNYTNINTVTWITTPVVWAATPGALIILGVFIAVGGIMRFTRVGRDVRAVGGDRRAALISGVPAMRVIVLTMLAGGMIAGFGGAIQAFSSADALSTVSFGTLITAVTAVVIGGLSLAGGRGTAGQMFIGVLVMAVFAEILSVTAANPNLSQVITGGFVGIIAITTPELRRWLTQLRNIVNRRTPASVASSRGEAA